MSLKPPPPRPKEMEADATMAAQGWSSLPADLVNRVADCLLATNDLDSYSDLRGVCHNWRSVTADPASNPHDSRFHPTRWIMLDELESSTRLSYRSKNMLQRMVVAQDDQYGLFCRCMNMFAVRDGVRLFVNAGTGRFLRRKLPLLRDCHLVASTTGGFLVLAGTAAPHAVRVLNPFTGALVRFKAPAPPENSMTASVVVVGGRLALVLAAIRHPSGCSIYLADPDSAVFVVETSTPWGTISSGAAEAAFGLLDPAMRSCVLPHLHRGLAAELGRGEMVRVDMWSLQQQQYEGVRVFRLLDSPQQLTSIGGRALFVGTRRCFSVDAASFAGIEPDCVYYYRKAPDECLHSHNIYVFDLAQGKEERIAEASIYPAPIVHLLLEYAMAAPSFEPSSEHSMRASRTNAAELSYLEMH